MFFDKYPDFIDKDVRKTRPNLTITRESLSKRCSAILPSEFILNKRILDIGSALGAMGHYALCNGAHSYTGVEIQKPYRDTSKILLSTYHNDNWEVLKSIEEITSTYDIVLACGVLHSYTDIFGFLRNMCLFSDSSIVLETNNPDSSSEPIIRFDSQTPMVSTKTAKVPRYFGLAALPNKAAIDLIMSINGFKEQLRIFPEPITGSHDGYSDPNTIQHRFISRYIKTTKLTTLETIIIDDNLEV